MKGARFSASLCCLLAISLALMMPFVGRAQQLTLVETKLLWVGGTPQLPSQSHPGETGDMGTAGAWWKYQCHFEGCTYHDVTLHVTWQVPQQATTGQEIVIEVQVWGEIDARREKYSSPYYDAIVCFDASSQCSYVATHDIHADPLIVYNQGPIRIPSSALENDGQGRLKFRLHVQAGPLDAYVHYFFQAEAAGGQAPRITSLDWPPQVIVGAPGTLSLEFEDPDGDVSWVTVEKLISGSWTFAGETSAGVTGQTRGRINAPLSCTQDQVGQVQARVILRDAAGHSSTPLEFSFECISGGTPTPPPPNWRDQLLVDGQETTTITLMSSGEEAVISVRCANLLSAIALAIAAAERPHMEAATPEVIVLLIAYEEVEDFCARQRQQQPASAVVAGANDGLALLGLHLPAGRARFQAQHSLLSLGIHTDTTTVRSEGQNDFSVEYDPDTGTSVVAVHSGAVDVEPTNSTLPSMTLGAGQQVEVTEDGVGPVTHIGSEDDSTSIEQALDANGNGVLDDAEIRKAVQYWIRGQTVPGTDEIIDDAKILRLIQMWILGTPVES